MAKTLTSVAALETATPAPVADNMTPLQRAASDVVSGSKLATQGRVGMTFELATMIRDNVEVSFTFDKETHTRTFLDYLEGERRDTDGKKDNKRLLAFWSAIRDNHLGTDVADDGIVRSAFVAALRAAAGVVALRHVGDHIGTTDDGTVMLRAGHALTLQDNTGKPTKAGKALFEEAKRRENTRAEVRAEMTGNPVEYPSEATIWDAAFAMPITCDGSTLPGTDIPVPTNTKALDILRDAGVEAGLAPERGKRAPRTPSGDDADAAFATALTVLTEQLRAVADTDESPVDLDKHGDALLALRDLINTLDL